MIETMLTEHLDLLTTTHTTRSASGRGSGNKLELTGIKKLRELILELAVRGKLVAQNPEDEPASELLERIEAEKARLVKEKLVKKPKKLPKITEEEQPFNLLPKQWEWVRLNDLGEWGAGATPRRGNSELYGGGIPWFKSGELSSDYISESEETVTELALKQSSLRYNNIGDVLVAMYGATIGKTAILNVRATTNQAVCACTPFTGFINTYLLILLKAFKGRLIGMGAGGAQPNISREKIIATVIALPPEAEQHRIVAKVDELMALCDQLEQEETDSIAAHQTLVDAMLTTLTDSKDVSELAENWSLVAEHFDTLFTTEASITRLRQTILQLAVMGRLVPQNPGDEPAAKLLECIAAEKAQLVKDGKIKKQKPSLAITQAEQLFPLPEGWTWCRIDHLALHSEAGWSPKCNDTPRTDDHWGVLKVSAVTWGEYRPGQNKQLPDHLDPRAEYEVQPNDFLISRANTADLVARSVVVPETAPEHLMMSDKIIRFVFSCEVSSHYINLYNNCRFARDYYASVAGGTSSSMKNVSRQQIQSLVIPIPSLAEQQRIQIRVNELMSLCDTLQQQLQQAQITQQQLAFALVEQTLTPHHQTMSPQPH